MTYTIRNIGHVDEPQIIREDGAVIPHDEANRDYREYLAWIAEGNKPQEWEPPVTK